MKYIKIVQGILQLYSKYKEKDIKNDMYIQYITKNIGKK